jgi:aminomethyltransferase
MRLNFKKSIFKIYSLNNTSQFLFNSKIHTSLPRFYSEDDHSKVPKKTFLYDFHMKHSGKIVDFAGWYMPIQYKDQNIQQSHAHTRTKCSLFDVSHMMQTKIHGKDRFKFIESLVVSDIEGLKPDNGTLTVFTNERGGIIDDLIVTNTSQGYLYVVSNAGCADQDLAHMKQLEKQMKSDKFDVTIERLENHGLLALQGPLMKEALQDGVDFDLK